MFEMLKVTFDTLKKNMGNESHGRRFDYGASILDSSSSCKQPLRNSSCVNWPSPFSSIFAKMFRARSSAESAGRFAEHAPSMS